MKVVYQFFPDGSQSGMTVLSDAQYAKGFPPAPDGKNFVALDELLPSSACFYDAESNSILHMKEIEENGEIILVIDYDKEPVIISS